MTTRHPATVASCEQFALGEGPVWDAPRGRLLWVDIEGCAVIEGRLHTGPADQPTIEVVRRHLFDGMVGAVSVAADGSLLVAEQERLVVVHGDGRREVRAQVLEPGCGRRLNDGSTDPAGRFLVGSLPLEHDSQHEQLLRLEADGSLTELDADLTLSNGLAWSTDGLRMFSVDTLRQVIYARSYEPATGVIGPRCEHLRLADGYPDGIAVDAADHLWVAVWGCGQVRRFAPDGTETEVIDVAAPHTSCVAFAGDDLDVLVITTATKELTSEQLVAYPDSGRLFTARAPVPGAPVAAWNPVPRPTP